MRKSEVAEIVMMLFASYPAAKTVDKTSEVYELMLADLDYAVTRKAVTRLIATSKWLPTIAEIREACAALSYGPMRLGGEAWQDAMTEVRRTGRYGAPKFTDPLVAETIRMWGSWQGFCNSPEDDPGGRARFIELYEQLAARARADVVSGIALPAPTNAHRIAPVESRPTAAELVKSPTPPALELPTPKPRPVSPYAGRKLTADEIDAAMGAA
jgi:Loader and inhibitor of phage G40P